MIIIHALETQSEPSQTSMIVLSAEMVTYSLGADYMDIFSPSESFNSLNRDEISSRMSHVKRKQCKIKITIICMISSR